MSQFVNRVVLFPYFLALKLRDRAYKKGRKESFSFDVPVISIGNVTVGGTGKTPHVEFFIRHYLQEGKKVAVVSRGYGRSSRDGMEVTGTESASLVGDEPLQIKRKFPQVTMMVDKIRRRAIEKLISLEEGSRPDIILLDDAFQHRQVTPSRSIVLVNYNRPIFNDTLLPFGRLRDLPERIADADTVIITKAPPYLDEWEKEKCRQINRVARHQKLFFTSIDYATPLPVFPEAGNSRFIYSQEAIMITGIAYSRPMYEYMMIKYKSLSCMKFSDHHKFTRLNIRSIARMAKKRPLSLLLTTEKDAQRFLACRFIPDIIKERLFYLPIEVSLIEGES
ncbi:MAG: tetraacyldisaccharide 4'-kinase, partial [Bacteroidales bacterium]|nr:tetraacyldisaccharide 4'-kinase [Bacteroidales bacterium]